MAHDGRQPSRRSFLRGAAATGGFLALNRFNSVELASFRGAALPAPAASGIEHIVVLIPLLNAGRSRTCRSITPRS